MKRSVALAEIKWCGYHGDTEKAITIATHKGIGKSAFWKAYRDGIKIKKHGEPCGCAQCLGRK